MALKKDALDVLFGALLVHLEARCPTRIKVLAGPVSLSRPGDALAPEIAQDFASSDKSHAANAKARASQAVKAGECQSPKNTRSGRGYRIARDSRPVLPADTDHPRSDRPRELPARVSTNGCLQQS
jgi:hypothetical protein